MRGAQGERRGLARVRCRPTVFAFVSAPVDTPLLAPIPCSLGYNEFGDEGVSALAAILKETQITNLKCAAAPKVFAFMSAPVDTAPVCLLPPGLVATILVGTTTMMESSFPTPTASWRYARGSREAL